MAEPNELYTESDPAEATQGKAEAEPNELYRV
jgi:hypothetical protein